jgi:putative tricarboxylic transport membrane protein
MDKETRIWESIVAALVIGLSVLAWVVSASFPKGESAIVGPALFPRVLGVILIVSSLVVLFNSWRSPLSVMTSSATGSGKDFAWSKLARAFALLAAFALTPLLLAQFGLLITAVVLTVGVCFLLGAKWHEVLIAGAVMLVFVYLVFILLLKVGS